MCDRPLRVESGRSARRVQRALAAAGISTQVVELLESTRTAVDAAAAIGCRAEQIAKSLVFRCRGSEQPVLVVAGGAKRVDEHLVSAYLNAEIVKADANFLRVATGFAIGGVPPLGHDSPLRTLIDEDVVKLDIIWAAAGTPHAVFSVDPQRLIQVIGGDVVSVSKPPPQRA
ncbi:MAG: YbaK/EbsC family protein [Burkholderiales bacterium]